MNVLVISDDLKRTEFEEKLKTLSIQKVTFAQTNSEYSTSELQAFEIIFDLNFNGDINIITNYAQVQNRIFILNAVNYSLNQFTELLNQSKSIFVGINALPSFINLPKAELTCQKITEKPMIEKVFTNLNWPIQWVENRVGMLTPRVVCMIINEAFYTLQEGTASKKDIDTSMKLGTNYPFGPFEWAEKIGIDNVYDMLDYIYNDTHDERYKVCPLLKLEKYKN
jgi:3-hydroxybutyryl-CoA dehydrogenase